MPRLRFAARVLFRASVPALVAASLAAPPAPAWSAPGRAFNFEWIGKIELEAEGLSSADQNRRRQAVATLGQYDIALTLPYLMPALRDQDRHVREEVARILARHKIAQVTPVVMEWLEEPDPEVRQAAAPILGEIATEEATAALIRTLGDPDDRVRQRAITALGAIGTPQVVVPLIGRLEDEKSEVRKAAIAELERIADRRAVIPLVGLFTDSNLDVRQAAVRAVGRLGDSAPVPALLRLIQDPAEEIKKAAVTSLGNLGAITAVDRLIDELGQGSDGYRGLVAYALGQIARIAAEREDTRLHSERAVRALVAALAARTTRTAAAEALRHAGSAAVPGLVAHLEGQIDGDLGKVIELLRDIGDPRATPALLAELDRGRVARTEVLEALSQSGDKAALVPILGLLSAADTDAELRLAAMKALGPLIDDLRAADVLAKQLDDKRLEIRVLAAEYLGLMRSKAAVPRLIELTRAGVEPPLRTAAIEALGEIGDARAADALVGLLETGPAPFHHAAASSLVYMGDATHAPRLLALAQDPGAGARFHAVRALGGILRDGARSAGAKPAPVLAQARAVLEALAQDATLELSLAAIEALGAVGDRASVPVLTALLGTDGHRRRAAATALGNLGDAQVVPALIEALDAATDDRVSADVAWALGKLGDERALPALVRATRRRGWATGINASAALARLATGRHAGELVVLLGHKSRLVRANAAWGLGRLADAAARPALVSALQTDGSWLVRMAAARALSRLGGAAQELAAAAEAERDLAVREVIQAAAKTRFDPPGRTDWRSFHIVDPDKRDAPVRQEAYFVCAADGLCTAFYSDARGMAGEEQFPPGDYILEPQHRDTQY